MAAESFNALEDDVGVLLNVAVADAIQCDESGMGPMLVEFL